MSGTREPTGIVVVGASLAGLRAAEALRGNGYGGPLAIVGDEPYLPYDRPPLSKHVLAGELAPDATELPNLVPLDARWHLGQAAIGLDRHARTVTLAGGIVLPFDRLLIATGAKARPWPGPAGGPLSGVHTLRGRDDAAALRAALVRNSDRVVIVGAGLIGCEAASCCRDLGLPVTLLDPNPTPLARSLGTVVGGVIAGSLRDAGVDFRPRTQVRALEGDGAVRRVVLADDTTIETALVIVALGAVRGVGWLAAAGLMADAGGITCDGFCRVLAADGAIVPGIYAAGDVARWPNPIYDGRLVSIEHWGNAVEQGRHAARNMLAEPDAQREYDHLPAFWSSQFGINIKAVGLTEGADSLAVVQGSLGARRFLAVYGRVGLSIAAVSFDEARWLPAYAERIAARRPFPPIRDANDQPAIVLQPPGFPPPRAVRVDAGAMGGLHV